MVVSFIYIVLLRWLAGVLVWVTTYAVLTLIGYVKFIFPWELWCELCKNCAKMFSNHELGIKNKFHKIMKMSYTLSNHMSNFI